MNKRVLLALLLTIFVIYVLYHYLHSITYGSNIRRFGPHLIDFNPNQECYLITCSMGNLGNQIWEYMSLFVVWKRFIRYGHIPYIEENMLKNLKLLFRNLTISTAPQINITSICNSSKGKWIIPKTDSLDKYTDWFQVNKPCRDIFLGNYSTRYEDILEYKTKIKQEMRFHRRLVHTAQNKLRKIRERFNMTKANVTFVGMHYRGDDYVQHLKRYYGIDEKDLPDCRYYKGAMEYFKQTYSNVIFILISADQIWLNKNKRSIRSVGNVVINPHEANPNQDLVRIRDLALLSHCNHSVISYGTFGVTTAFFANGTTYVYDLNLPLDYRGATIALGFARLLPNWYKLTNLAKFLPCA